MSAANIFVTETAVHAFCDGACYAPDTAIVQGHISKVAKLPELSAIAAALGTPAIRMLVEATIGESGYDDFDDAAERFGEDLRQRVRRRPEYFNGGAFVVTLAGWSQKSGAPRAFVFNGYRDRGTDGFIGRPAKRVVQPHDAWLAAYSFDEAKAEERGLQLLEAQRQQRWAPVHSQHEFFAVGGFAEYTKLTQSEITTKILRRWPDQIGATIVPKGIVR